MSSGRDVYLERLATEQKEQIKTDYRIRAINRMIEYRKTLLTEIERLDKLIWEMQNEHKESSL